LLPQGSARLRLQLRPNLFSAIDSQLLIGFRYGLISSRRKVRSGPHIPGKPVGTCQFRQFQCLLLSMKLERFYAQPDANLRLKGEVYA